MHGMIRIYVRSSLYACQGALVVVSSMVVAVVLSLLVNRLQPKLTSRLTMLMLMLGLDSTTLLGLIYIDSGGEERSFAAIPQGKIFLRPESISHH